MKENSEIEIDLIKNFYKILIEIKKNILLISIFAIIGLGVGIVKSFYYTKPIYQTSALFVSPYQQVLDTFKIAKYQLPDIVCINNVIESINTLKNDNKIDELSKLLKLSKSNIDLLIDVNTEFVPVNEVSIKNTERYTKLKVTLSFSEKIEMNDLTNSLINFVESDLYIKNKFDFFKMQNIFLMNKIDSAIRILENKQKAEEKNQNINQNSPNILQKEITEMYEKRLECELFINQFKPIDAVNHFSEIKIVKPNRFIQIIKFFFIFLVFASIVIVAKIVIRKISDNENNIK